MCNIRKKVAFFLAIAMVLAITSFALGSERAGEEKRIYHTSYEHEYCCHKEEDGGIQSVRVVLEGGIFYFDFIVDGNYTEYVHIHDYQDFDLTSAVRHYFDWGIVYINIFEEFVDSMSPEGIESALDSMNRFVLDVQLMDYALMHAMNYRNDISLSANCMHPRTELLATFQGDISHPDFCHGARLYTGNVWCLDCHRVVGQGISHIGDQHISWPFAAWTCTSPPYCFRCGVVLGSVPCDSWASVSNACMERCTRCGRTRSIPCRNWVQGNGYMRCSTCGNTQWFWRSIEHELEIECYNECCA
jgi:hypothetical protein